MNTLDKLAWRARALAQNLPSIIRAAFLEPGRHPLDSRGLGADTFLLRMKRIKQMHTSYSSAKTLKDPF